MTAAGRGLRRPLSIAAATVLLSLTGFVRPEAALACPGWAVQATPNPASGPSQLLGIGEVSPTDVWAVGLTNTPSPGAPLAEHFNGTSWSIVPTASASGWLWAVDGAASNDVWAGGDGVLERWRGSSWSRVTIPLPRGASSPVVRDIDVVSANDVWAVGWYTKSVERTLVLHWNGSSWSRIASPNQGRRISTELWGIAVRSASDVWTVGGYLNRGEFTYSAHWNGTGWTKPAMPASPSTQETYLGQVATVGTAGAWAVGSSGSGPLIERFQAGAWHIVAGVAGVDFLHGLIAFSATNVYASGGDAGEPAVEHWNGTSWNAVTTPSVPPGANGLWDLDGTAGTDLWAAGDQGDGSGGLSTLVEHAC